MDQSVDDSSQSTYDQVVGDDPRFSYFRSATVGKPTACNKAVAAANGAILALTDDDCVVPANWLARMEVALSRCPRVAAVCGGVSAAPHDPCQGFVPTFTPERPRLHRSVWLAFQAEGLGANMVVRAQAIREIGGFDEILGPGAPVGSGSDSDILFRLLSRGHWILHLPEPAVIHHGIRTWGREARRRMWTYAMSTGAISAKHLRCLDVAFLPSAILGLCAELKWRNILRFRGNSGATNMAAHLVGVLMSLQYEIDRPTRTYLSPARGRASRSPLIPAAEWWRTRANDSSRDRHHVPHPLD